MTHNSIPADIRRHPDFRTIYQDKLKHADTSERQDIITRLLNENEEFYQSVDFDLITQKLINLSNELRKSLVNRVEITNQGLRAFMTAEHQFIFSSAGVAKSLYAKQIFSYFSNASTYSIQFCPDTTPDDLFGAYDIEKFKKGEIFHNIEGSIITSPFAFLDEFMDGNDKLLRSLLGVLLERRFISGNQEEEAVLHSAIATSNYLRENETTAALLDRFLYKSFITPAKDVFTLLKIDSVFGGNSGHVRNPDKNRQISLRELHAVYKLIKGQITKSHIHIPIEIQYLKNIVATGFEQEMKKYRDDYYLSPRTISKSNDLLKANALIRGSKVVTEEDVKNLYYLFCTLNEPLDDKSNILSQQLFTQVYQAQVQYFHSIQEELIPLLIIFNYMNEAQRDIQKLDQPIELPASHKSASRLSEFKNYLGKLVNFSTDQRENNKKALLEFVKSYHSQHQDVNHFKQKLIDLIEEVFNYK